jgi:hypothetical protein
MSETCCVTVPSINNFLLQHESRRKKYIIRESIEQKYRSTATLQDLAADVLINLPEQLDVLASILPEGNPPWHTLIKAWQRSRKIKSRPTNTPRDKLFKLLDRPTSNIL